MSEKQKKSRARILLTVGALLVLYPLSIGPVMGIIGIIAENKVQLDVME